MPEAMPWLSSEPKGLMLEAWFLSVMCDPDLRAADIRVAWALQFLFNSKTGKAWANDKTIGHSVHLASETVRKSVGVLVSAGHLVKTRERRKGRSARILQAALAHRPGILRVGQGVPLSEPAAAESGTGRPRKVGQGVPVRVGQGVPQNLRDDPENDPGRVQDMALAASVSETDDDEDLEDPPF